MTIVPKPSTSRRSFLRTMGRGVLRVTAAGAAGLLYSTRGEPHWLDVNQVSLSLPHLDPAFHGFRVVQISDLHVDRSGWMNAARLSGIVEEVNRQRPDLVVMTGDFVTSPPFEARYSEILVGTLHGLKPREKTLAILGNHDYWTDPGRVRHVIRDSGMIDLTHRVYTVHRSGALLHFAGMDDLWRKPEHPKPLWSHRNELEELIHKMPASGAAILLAHEPDFADVAAASGRFALQLSGHSHGGQVNIPFIGPPRLPPLGRKYHTGQYQVGSMIQYTNRGTGMISPHVRFNCRPEITVFTFVP